MGREIVPGSESLKYDEKEIWNIRNLRCRLCRKDEENKWEGVCTASTVKNDKDFLRFVKWDNGSYKMENVVSLLKIC